MVQTSVVSTGANALRLISVLLLLCQNSGSLAGVGFGGDLGWLWYLQVDGCWLVVCFQLPCSVPICMMAGLVFTGGWGLAAQGWWGLCCAIGDGNWWDVARRATTQGCPYVDLYCGRGDS